MTFDSGSIIIDHKSAIPKYIQLKTQLISMITKGTFTPDGRIPSDNEFISRLKIARSTVRQALDELEKEGLIERQHGRGTFITRGVVSGKAAATAGMSFGVFFPNLVYFYPAVIRAIENEAYRNGHHVILCTTDYDPAKEKRRLLNLFAEQYLDGLIIRPLSDDPASYESLKTRNIPIVSMDERIPGLDAPAVLQDNAAGIRIACEHLVSKGHRKIGYIDALPDYTYRRERLKAFEEFDGRCGKKTLTLDFNTPERNIEKLIRFLKSADLTAVVCINDRMAGIVLDVCKILGYGVPSRLAVVGYDNEPFASSLTVPLTTIDPSKAEIGKTAMTLLAGLAGGSSSDAVPSRDVSVSPKLIERSLT